MAHLLLHAISHSLEDVIKSAPILLVVYAVLYWLEHKMRAAPALLEKAQKVGPVIGGLAGSVPQCGFSAAASALFAEGFLHPATLVAVFLATSDEAVPLLLAGGLAQETLLLLITKLVLAIVGGYLLQWTVFRNGCAKQRRSKWTSAITATTAAAPRLFPPSCGVPCIPVCFCLEL